MNRKTVIGVLALFVVTTASLAMAQQSGKVSRVGILRAGAPPDVTLESFLQGMRELGYIGGKNIHYEIRYAEGNQKRSSELAKELTQLNPDALFTSGTRSILDLKQATKTIPIVIVSTSDPIGTG